MQFTEVKIEVFIPEEYIEMLRNELNKIGACKTGEYDHCLSYSSVKGYWRPLENASPFNGKLVKYVKGKNVKLK